MFHVHLAQAQIPPAGKPFSGQPSVIRGLQSTTQHNIVPILRFVICLSFSTSDSQIFSSSYVLFYSPLLFFSRLFSMFLPIRICFPGQNTRGVFRASGECFFKGTSGSQNEPMRSCITHFSWSDAGSCEVPSKPTLVKAKGVGRYMCVFLWNCMPIMYSMFIRVFLCDPSVCLGRLKHCHFLCLSTGI